jgi:hypothetical protein
MFVYVIHHHVEHLYPRTRKHRYHTPVVANVHCQGYRDATDTAKLPAVVCKVYSARFTDMIAIQYDYILHPATFPSYLVESTRS